ncbi:MAG TPA: 16S rRNA (adenine(1518)-N(6)/adenine(1519)-N(6))-dimethyltransferase RsmA [Candidatus Paceibacterota bacterium]
MIFNMDFIAKKSLGQNFLHAPQVISKMIHTTNITPDDIVLEVGPGKGALTEKLLEIGAKVIAVEKDDRLISFLSDKFSKEIESGQLKIIHQDILDFNPSLYGLSSSNYSIIANIPYYISGEFLRKFLESDIQPSRMVIMLQKELAKRIVDKKGSILSISVKAYGNPKYITSVPRKFFRPMPNVDSAMLLIENISKKFFLRENRIEDERKKQEREKKEDIEMSPGKEKINNRETRMSEKRFFELVKAGFAHKRKVLIKNIEEIMTKDDIKEIWESQKWSLTLRAEELTIEDWMKIACFPQK